MLLYLGYDLTDLCDRVPIISLFDVRSEIDHRLVLYWNYWIKSCFFRSTFAKRSWDKHHFLSWSDGLVLIYRLFIDG